MSHMPRQIHCDVICDAATTRLNSKIMTINFTLIKTAYYFSLYEFWLSTLVRGFVCLHVLCVLFLDPERRIIRIERKLFTVTKPMAHSIH